MQRPFFSIVVVSLNPGERLRKTLESIVEQSFQDYEVILKDGGSTDGSLERLKESGFLQRYPQIHLIEQRDRSIYDGMNQAVKQAKGKYIQFLNCGDYFYQDTVLTQVAEFIDYEQKKVALLKEETSSKILDNESREKTIKTPVIYYGNQYNQLQDAFVYSAPRMNDFTCYRNVPCHQVCFYEASLFQKRAYDLKYRVRADYEHFLYSIYVENANAISMPIVIASYEGGGFSETKENRRVSAMEHREITEKYLGKNKVFKYRLILWMTLAPVRTKIAESPILSKGYNAVKSGIYKIIRR